MISERTFALAFFPNLTISIVFFFSVILPRLKVMTERNTEVEDLTDRLEIAEELIIALQAALCCCILFTISIFLLYISILISINIMGSAILPLKWK